MTGSSSHQATRVGTARVLIKVPPNSVALDLVQSAAKVESEIAAHTEEVATRLDEQFVPILDGWGEGQTRPDFRATLRALQAKLSDSREALSLVEQHHIGLIRQAVEQGILTRGILYECVKRKVPFVLAGSLRDDGPLPECRVINSCIDFGLKTCLPVTSS